MTKTNPDPILHDQAMSSRRSVFTVLILEQRRNGVSSSSGTGFVIKSSGGKCIVLTCEHVVSDFCKARVTIYIRRFQNAGIEQLPAKVVHFDESADIAILEVEGLTELVPALTFSSAIVPIGAKAIAVGYCNPDDLFLEPAFARLPAVSPGQVRSRENRGRRRGGITLGVDCVGMLGMSGGPVLCMGGVTGVISSGCRGRTNVISTDTVHRVLKRWLRIGNNDLRTIQEVVNFIPM